MKYNRDHTSVFAALFANRMQCYSGTILFNLIYAKLKKSAYSDSNQVFIYEDGHVLPGYMTRIDNQWHLFGIETTLNGLAKKIYGPTSGLQGVRVVDAHVALGVEALKNQITNKAFVVKTALEKTAKLYDIPLDQTEASLSNVFIPIDGFTGSVTGNTSVYLNAGLFDFGDSSHVPQGDLERETLDEFIAKPGGSGKSILTDPNNWKNTTTLNQQGVKTIPQVQGTGGQTKTNGGPNPNPQTVQTPGTQQMTDNGEWLKVRINQDLVLTEVKEAENLPKNWFLSLKWFLLNHQFNINPTDFPIYEINNECVLANTNKIFSNPDGPNVHSKKNLKTGEVFNVLGYNLRYPFSNNFVSPKELTLLMVSETSEEYLWIKCFGDDIRYLRGYSDLEQLLGEVFSFEEKRNPVTETSINESKETHPPFMFYPPPERTTDPHLLDINKGLGSKKIEVHANLQLVKDSFSVDESNKLIEADYSHENEKCSLVVNEIKSAEENSHTNKYKEFYVSFIGLNHGYVETLHALYPYTLMVSAETKDYHSSGKEAPRASLFIQCINRNWTLSTSPNDIEKLLDGAISFVDEKWEPL